MNKLTICKECEFYNSGTINRWGPLCDSPENGIDYVSGETLNIRCDINNVNGNCLKFVQREKKNNWEDYKLIATIISVIALFIPAAVLIYLIIFG